jgi:hypothetical protein
MVRRGDLDANLDLVKKDHLGHGLTITLHPDVKKIIKDWPADQEISIHFDESKTSQQRPLPEYAGFEIRYHDEPASHPLEIIYNAITLTKKI